jgi:hypothetical protein
LSISRRRIGQALPGALRRAVPRLRQLGRAELLLLAQAPFALPLAALALRRWGLGGVQRWIARQPAAAVAPADPPAQLQLVERLSWCVQIAAAYGPWPANCLQRSMVLCWFLRRRGLAGDLRIGVRVTDDGSMDFHAWVEHQGRVVNDRRDVAQRYAVFDGPIAAGVRFS